MNRKTFLKTSLIGASGISVIPSMLMSASSDGPEPLKIETVKEFVVAGHSDLNQVKEMLVENPNLIYCRYDWGGGDFEEAIEGAGHMGESEIAEYLIENGARVNLFVLTMLGKTELVRPVLNQYPSLIQAKGAHGFTLLYHAEKGGERSAELYDYLLSKGLTEKHIKIK